MGYFFSSLFHVYHLKIHAVFISFTTQFTWLLAYRYFHKVINNKVCYLNWKWMCGGGMECGSMRSHGLGSSVDCVNYMIPAVIY